MNSILYDLIFLDASKPIDVSRLNLKIGKIIDVKRHPDADGLFIETGQ